MSWIDVRRLWRKHSSKWIRRMRGADGEETVPVTTWEMVGDDGGHDLICLFGFDEDRSGTSLFTLDIHFFLPFYDFQSIAIDEFSTCRSSRSSQCLP